jgi:hypothetical protein
VIAHIGLKQLTDIVVNLGKNDIQNLAYPDNWLVRSRVFYNIPFQRPAAIGLGYIKREKYGSMILLSLCIWLIPMAIRSLTNFSF